jgi:hypothetical protein
MQMTKLYILSDGDGPVRYVGKTVQPLSHRLSSHRSAAKRNSDHRSRWICSALDLRIDLVAEVLGDGCAEERLLIASLRGLGASLTNYTAGGEGKLGLSPSQETRERIRAKLAGRPGRKWTEETREKVRAALKGRRPSPQAIEATRRALTGRKNGPLTDECKARIRAARLRITDEMLNTARALVAKGWSQQRAADSLGVSQSQLSLRLSGRYR